VSRTDFATAASDRRVVLRFAKEDGHRRDDDGQRGQALVAMCGGAMSCALTRTAGKCSATRLPVTLVTPVRSVAPTEDLTSLPPRDLDEAASSLSLTPVACFGAGWRGGLPAFEFAG